MSVEEEDAAEDASHALVLCECCGALDCRGECDTLRPKQQLPLPAVPLMGKGVSARTFLAAATEAASAVACADDGALSEGEKESFLQRAAENYLLSVRLEAEALPRICCSGPLTERAKQPSSVALRQTFGDQQLDADSGTAEAESANDGGSAGCPLDGRVDANQSSEVGLPCARGKEAQSTETPQKGRKTRYLERILRLQNRQVEHHPPSAAWEEEALQFFKQIRLWIESQRVSEATEEGTCPSVLKRCRDWTGQDWQIYCRLYPPSLPFILRCDARCIDTLLTQLLADLEVQLRLHSLHEGKSRMRVDSMLVSCLDTKDKGASQSVESAAEELASESEDGEERSRSDGKATGDTFTSHNCCSSRGVPTSLPQLLWLFAALAMLDPLEALRAEVSFALQRLRRQCLKLRRIILKRLGCTDSCHQKHLLERRKPHDFFASFDRRRSLEGVQLDDAFKQSEEEFTCGQLLAGVDTLILIVRDFFGQK